MRKGIIRRGDATTSIALFLPARQDRVGLTLFAPASGSYTVGDSSSVSNGYGVYLVAGMAPVVLNEENAGDLVKQALYVIASGSIGFGFIELTGS
ncbi:MAG: hypothetical protein ACOYOB_19770 [Myxococcota bacterium]|jgi:hypothetical protein